MVADALRELLEAAAEAGARRALELAGQREPSSLVPIREAPVSYRAILKAAKEGEMKIVSRGKSSFVDRAELERWIRAGAPPKRTDPIDALIAGQRRRRKETE